MILVSHISLQDHVTKGSSNFMDSSCSGLVDIVANLVAIGTQVLEMLLVCQVILHGHVIRVSRDCINRGKLPI